MNTKEINDAISFVAMVMLDGGFSEKALKDLNLPPEIEGHIRSLCLSHGA